ncbi:MAG: hypothetical protein WCC36_05950, partial [Gammaproteobacteria bacterium]
MNVKSSIAALVLAAAIPVSVLAQGQASQGPPIAGPNIAQMQQRFQQMQQLMNQARGAHGANERQHLLVQHMELMQQQMHAMGGMMGPAGMGPGAGMGSGAGMG